MRGKIAMVLSGFPRRSETFALNEVWALERRGALAAIFATKAGEPVATQPAGRALLGRVQVLTEREGTGQAEELIRLLDGTRISAIHGYFAHAPAEVAERVSMQLGIPFGFSVHAKDARKVAPDILSARARKAACVVACNRDVACELQNSGAQVHLVPHGVDLERFIPQPFPETKPLQLLAVGRLVEKKGFHILIEAAAQLHVPFQLDIVGEGPEEKRLTELIHTHGLESKVRLCGPKTHQDLPETYSRAHALVAPSIVDKAGDRDGLPNVVLEAMACGRPVIASDVAALGSAVIHEQTGLLTAPGNSESLASAIELLANQQSMLGELGMRARVLVEHEYDVQRCTERFHNLLRSAYAC
ncbi:MAG TPA: glycosyltransferase family 4 protein [Candidatus Angelobacter sp.]|jgi:glycosyltransferase involved in cell wall biosynthesis